MSIFAERKLKRSTDGIATTRPKPVTMSASEIGTPIVLMPPEPS